MSTTTTFRRHDRVRLDAAIHRVFQQLEHNTHVCGAFADMLWEVSARSNLLRTAPEMAGGVAQFPWLDALRNLARQHRQFLRTLDDWSGAHGHPLHVIDSICQHVFGPYPTPRFLSKLWFGGNSHAECSRRQWVMRHARGERFRSLPTPIRLTRRMEHWFLRTPDHLDLDSALRRAEVLGLGGSPALADAVVATRLGRHFDDRDYWRGVLTWLVHHEDDLVDGEVAWLVAHFQEAHRGDGPPRFDRRPAALRRERDERLAQRRVVPPRQRRVVPPPEQLSWPGSRWGNWRGGDWRVVELLSSEELRAEGTAMRHCVGSYGARCHSGFTRIFSLRRDGDRKPVLTIELDPHLERVTTVRGYANRVFEDHELAPLQKWTSSFGFGVSGTFAFDVQRHLEKRAGGGAR